MGPLVFYRKKNHHKSEINVTPLVDVMLVLLIIFMVAAPMSKVGISVDLPKTSTAQALAEESDPVIVSLNEEGKLFLKDVEVLEEDLPQSLKSMAKEDTRIYVRGDQKLPYGRVVHIMSMIASSGYSKVSLITESSKK